MLIQTFLISPGQRGPISLSIRTVAHRKKNLRPGPPGPSLATPMLHPKSHSTMLNTCNWAYSPRVLASFTVNRGFDRLLQLQSQSMQGPVANNCDVILATVFIMHWRLIVLYCLFQLCRCLHHYRQNIYLVCFSLLHTPDNSLVKWTMLSVAHRRISRPLLSYNGKSPIPLVS